MEADKNYVPKIYQVIPEVMKKISAVSKDRKNAQQGFQYRGIDDVMNELHPIMAECGLFVVPYVVSEDRELGTSKNGSRMVYVRQRIRFTFFTTDGSSVEAEVIGEAMDSGDKASNKALSIGLKYAMLQLFCIPTEEEKDPDAESPALPQQPKQQPKKPATKLKGGDSTPAEKEQIKALLETKAPDGTGFFSTAEMKKYAAMRVNLTAAELISIISAEKDKRYAASLAKSLDGEVVQVQQAETEEIF